jgi:SPP1 gp7 family putative phage head morphogenesis protein
MTRTAHLAAVRELEAAAELLVFESMAAVLERVAGHLAAVTAAAGDTRPAEPTLSVDDTARLPVEWTLEVDGRLLPWYREVYDAGANAAVEQVTEMRRPTDLLPEVADDVADDIPAELTDAELDDVGLGGALELPDVPEPEPLSPAGRLSADVGLGDDAGPILIDTAGDPLLLDENATRHLAGARNRFLQAGDETWAEARQALLEGMARGDGVEAMQRRFQDVVDVGRARASMIARTEVISAANAGSTARVRAMGEDAPRYKQWLSTMDARTRPTHAHADGQVVELSAKFKVGDAQLDYPGDPAGLDAEVINCRCSVLYVDDPAGEDLSAIPGRQTGGTPLTAAAQLAPTQMDSTTGEPHDGGMLALVPTETDAARLAGLGEPPESIHLTLFYLGDDIPTGVAERILTNADLAAGQMTTLLADAFGAAVWNPGSDLPALVLSVGGPGLVEAASVASSIVNLAALDAQVAEFEALTASAAPDALCGWETCGHAFRAHALSSSGTGAMAACSVAGCGCTDFAMPGSVERVAVDDLPELWVPPEQHVPWVAHICLAYADDPAAMIDDALTRTGPVMFDRLRVAMGGEAYDFPLVDLSVEMSGAGIAFLNKAHDSKGRFAPHSGGGGGGAPSGAPSGGGGPDVEAGPRSFGEGNKFDKAAADEFGEEGFGEWRGSLTGDQRKAVRAYTDSGYSQRMNDRLRGVEPSAADRRKLATTDKHVENMRAAFDAPGAELPEHVTLHRGMQGPIAEALIKAHRRGGLLAPEGGGIGARFTDKGFVSTSTNRKIAQLGSADRNKRVTLEIDAPKGTKGIAPGSLSRFDVENEVILPPGTTFEVVGAGRKGGVLNLKVRIFPSG